MTLRYHITLKSVFIVVVTRFCSFNFSYNYVKTNEDTLTLSATKMFASDSSLWQYKVYSDMCYGFGSKRRHLAAGAILGDSHVSVAT